MSLYLQDVREEMENRSRDSARPTSIRLKFLDDKFDSEEGWIYYHKDNHITQRYCHQSHQIFAETSVSVRCAVAVAVSLLRGPWTWWNHGRSIDYRLNLDQSSDQVLAPVWWLWTRLGIRVFTPIALPGLSGLRLPLLLYRHFQGTASVDVYPDRGSEGTVIVRERLHGVENHVPLLSLDKASKMHLCAEAGTLPFPFPIGTGFCGLSRRLEDSELRFSAPRSASLRIPEHPLISLCHRH